MANETGITVPAPSQHDLDGGSSITATVAKVEGDMVAIVIDLRDADNLVASLRPRGLSNRDDREALEKLIELISGTAY